MPPQIIIAPPFDYDVLAGPLRWALEYSFGLPRSGRRDRFVFRAYVHVGDVAVRSE